MAAIDKIYGTPQQYDEFLGWCKSNRPSALKHFYQRPGGDGCPITNFPREQDMWMIANCPIQWVQDRLHYQYGPKYDEVKRVIARNADAEP